MSLISLVHRKSRKIELDPGWTYEPDENKQLEDVNWLSYRCGDRENYLHSPGMSLGSISNHGSHHIESHEVYSLNSHIQAFEQELRRIIIEFYTTEAIE